MQCRASKADQLSSPTCSASARCGLTVGSLWARCGLRGGQNLPLRVVLNGSSLLSDSHRPELRPLLACCTRCLLWVLAFLGETQPSYSHGEGLIFLLCCKTFLGQRFMTCVFCSFDVIECQRDFFVYRPAQKLAPTWPPPSARSRCDVSTGLSK